MQDGRKAVWSITYVSVAFFPSLKQNFIAYRSSSRPDYIFEIHQLWQSGFSRVYSNSYCSCLFEPEIIKIGQSPHKMYSNNVVNFHESTTILNTCTKKSMETYWRHRVYMSVDDYIYIYIYIYMQFFLIYLSIFSAHLSIYLCYPETTIFQSSYIFFFCVLKGSFVRWIIAQSVGKRRV